MAGVGARASISTTIISPSFAQPGDSLSVTTRVVNAGQTLAGLIVNQQLPGAAYQYVPGSLQISVSDGTVITNESEVLTVTGGTDLLFDLTRIQTADALTNLVISEVFPGSITNFLPTDPVSFQWFEIYNPSAIAISLAGWTIRDARPGVSATLPDCTVGPGQFLVLAASTNSFLMQHPGFTNAMIEVPGGSIGDGLNRYADGLFLLNSNGMVVDKVCWGFDTSAFSPSVAYISTTTASLARVPANANSFTASGWGQQNVPDPGSGVVQVGFSTGSIIDIGYQVAVACGGTSGSFTAATAFQQPPGAVYQTNVVSQFITFNTPFVQVTETPVSQSAGIGDIVIWQLQVRNSGFGIARNVVLYNLLGPDLSFVGMTLNPTNTIPDSRNQVVWDASVIPALVALNAGDAPVSITVTGKVTGCGGQLYSRGDATFGYGNSICQDTRQDGGGTLATVIFENKRPFLTVRLSPFNLIPVSYCSGAILTIAITNQAATNGCEAFGITLAPTFVQGYHFGSPSSGTTDATGALLLGALPMGASTNVTVAILPGANFPPATNILTHFLSPSYLDGCGGGYQSSAIRFSTALSDLPSASAYQNFTPSTLHPGTSQTNLTATISLFYSNMVNTVQTIVSHYPASTVANGWTAPDEITGGGVLDTDAHTVTWTVNMDGNGEAVVSYHMTVGSHAPGQDYASLTASNYLDCHGIVWPVAGDGNVVPIGAWPTNGYSLSSALSNPKPLVEVCEAQPFSMTVSNIPDIFPNRWTNVTWAASLLSPFTNYSAGVAGVSVFIGTNDVTSFVVITQSGPKLTVRFDGLNDHPDFSTPTLATNGVTVVWDSATGQPGNVTQIASISLGFARNSSWTVAASQMGLDFAPPFPVFESGVFTAHIPISQFLSPNIGQSPTNVFEPDYNVNLVLNLDANTNGQSVTEYVPNSTILGGLLTTSNTVLGAIEPVITNSVITWHLGNLGGFHQRLS